MQVIRNLCHKSWNSFTMAVERNRDIVRQVTVSYSNITKHQSWSLDQPFKPLIIKALQNPPNV
jgi:hypothetical protein